LKAEKYGPKPRLKNGKKTRHFLFKNLKTRLMFILEVNELSFGKPKNLGFCLKTGLNSRDCVLANFPILQILGEF